MISGHIYSADFDNSFELLSGFSPFGRQVFAVAAPWRVELHEPERIRLHDFVLPVVLIEQNDRASLVVQSQNPSETRGNYFKH